MQAVVASDFGGPEVLRLLNVPTPSPDTGELLIQVEACGVCFHDLLTRTGVLRRGIKPPFIPGHEPAGRVVAIGSGVEGFEVGQTVCSLPSEPCWCCHHCQSGQDHLCSRSTPLGHSMRGGGYAEYMTLRATNCLQVPKSIAATDAAILGCAISSVYRGHRAAAVRMGQTVIVTGAGGGTGLHSVQLAKLAGSHVVAITTSEGKIRAIRQAGAEEVILSPDGSFHAEVLRLTGGYGADVIVDHVGTPVWPSVLRSVAPGGTVVFVGQVSGESFAFNPGSLVQRNLRLIGTKAATLQDLRDVIDLVATGRLRPIVSRTLPLQEAAEAHRMLEQRQSTGRIVLLNDVPSGHATERE